MKDFRILLVAPNCVGDEGFYYPPIGIMYISSYLKSKGFQVDCINLNHHSIEAYREKLQNNRYDVVGTGGLYTQYQSLEDVIEETKKILPKAKIVLGGAIASGDPEFILKMLNPDSLVLGEGELSTVELMFAYSEGKKISDVKGIAYLDSGGNFVRNEAAPVINNLDSIPLPDYEGFEYGYYLENFLGKKTMDATLQNTPYEGRNRVGFIMTSRDCIGKCTFCFRVMGGKFRERSVENVFKEIDYLIENYKINRLHLIDDMFSAKKQHVHDFCKEYQKKYDMPWNCNLIARTVTPELLDSMKNAGCHMVCYGFESASPKVLKSMKKGITPKLIDKAIEETIKKKITIFGNFIFGDPAETLETMQETMKFTRKYPYMKVGFGIVNPYPGTDIYHRFVNNGLIVDKLQVHKAPTMRHYNMTNMDQLDHQRMKYLVNIESRIRRRGRLLKLRNLKHIADNIWQFDVKCKICGHLNSGVQFDYSELSSMVCNNCRQQVDLKKPFKHITKKDFFQTLRDFYYSHIMRGFALNRILFKLYVKVHILLGRVFLMIK